MNEVWRFDRLGSGDKVLDSGAEWKLDLKCF